MHSALSALVVVAFHHRVVAVPSQTTPRLSGSGQSLLGLGLLLVSLVVLSPVAARAAVFNIADGDVAGLVAAINTANGNGEADTINLASGGTYTLTAIDNAGNGLPIITSAITINGNGAVVGRSSAAGTPDFRVFNIATSGEVALQDVTVAGGRLFDSGGGIFNRGTLRVVDSAVTGNRSDGGAGIYNAGGSVKIENSTVSDNTDRFYGAGIWNRFSVGVLTVTNSSIINNSGRLRGTGIYNLAGKATLINSTVSGNISGAGIVNHLGGATLTLINSTVSGNGGTAPNDFGGISNWGGTLELVSSTVSDNTANARFAGIDNDTGTTVLKNTTLANNAPGDCSGVITVEGNNFIENPGACMLVGSGTVNGGFDPLLGPIADNGGPTQTHAPLLGSPVIDAVPLVDLTDVDGNPVTTDQRGVARPQGIAGDIGAVELVLNQPPTANAGLDQPAVECTGVAGTGCVTVTLDGTDSSDPDDDALTYIWEPGTLAGAVITPILPLGTHVFTLMVNDGRGGTDTDTVAVAVVDTIAPSLTVPADITQVAASPLGDAITFTATATDAGDASPVVTCTPASGATFLLGTTSIECVAEDVSGNISAPSSFDVTLTPGDETFGGLVTIIQGIGLQQGVENGLLAKANAAKKSLGNGSVNAVLGSLNALLNQISAQAGKKLTPAQASELTEAVTSIIAAIQNG